MKAMRKMHDKMMAARTPEQRRPMMAGHMKSMCDGMRLLAAPAN